MLGILIGILIFMGFFYKKINKIILSFLFKKRITIQIFSLISFFIMCLGIHYNSIWIVIFSLLITIMYLLILWSVPEEEWSDKIKKLIQNNK